MFIFIHPLVKSETIFHKRLYNGLPCHAIHLSKFCVKVPSAGTNIPALKVCEEPFFTVKNAARQTCSVRLAGKKSSRTMWKPLLPHVITTGRLVGYILHITTVTTLYFNTFLIWLWYQSVKMQNIWRSKNLWMWMMCISRGAYQNCGDILGCFGVRIFFWRGWLVSVSALIILMVAAEVQKASRPKPRCTGAITRLPNEWSRALWWKRDLPSGNRCRPLD